MRFKINEIGEEGLPVSFPVTAAWLAAECPDLEARPSAAGILVRGELVRTGDDVFLRGDLKGAVDTTCARCLEPARVDLEIPLAVTYFDRSEEDDEPDAADLEVAYFDGDVVDLGLEVRDQILLAMPVSPLCSESCRGLCPVCGGNRNQSPCDCEERQRLAATPLAVLAKLKV